MNGKVHTCCSNTHRIYFLNLINDVVLVVSSGRCIMVRIKKDGTIICVKTLYQNLSKGSRKSTNVSNKITGLRYAVGAIIISSDSFPICSFHSTFVTGFCHPCATNPNQWQRHQYYSFLICYKILIKSKKFSNKGYQA
jgi:hypothetical protein